MYVNSGKHEMIRHYTLEVLKRCKIDIKINIEGKNIPFTIHVPSGDMKYGSFWIREAVMMAESGLIDGEEIKDWVSLVALKGQNGSEKFNQEGAPFEWHTAGDKEYSGKFYGASAALPYAGFVRLMGHC